MLQVFLERAEHAGRVIADIERADDVGHRTNGDQQAPERAEQAEEDRQADQVTRNIARLIQPRLHAIEQGAHRMCGKRRAISRAIAEHACHRRQQACLALDRALRVGATEGFHPARFAGKHGHLAQVGDDAGDQHAEYHAIEERIGIEHLEQARVHQHNEDADQNKEGRHPGQGTVEADHECLAKLGGSHQGCRIANRRCLPRRCRALPCHVGISCWVIDREFDPCGCRWFRQVGWAIQANAKLLIRSVKSASSVEPSLLGYRRYPRGLARCVAVALHGSSGHGCFG